jgi:SOS-response transcriptional repressor LexA
MAELGATVRSELDDADRQRELLLFVLDVWDRRHRVPTYDDIADAQQTSKSGVHRAIRLLLQKGYLRCDCTPAGRVKTGTVEPTDKAFRWRGDVGGGEEPRAR